MGGRKVGSSSRCLKLCKAGGLDSSVLEAPFLASAARLVASLRQLFVSTGFGRRFSPPIDGFRMFSSSRPLPLPQRSAYALWFYFSLFQTRTRARDFRG